MLAVAAGAEGGVSVVKAPAQVPGDDEEAGAIQIMFGCDSDDEDESMEGGDKAAAIPTIKFGNDSDDEGESMEGGDKAALIPAIKFVCDSKDESESMGDGDKADAVPIEFGCDSDDEGVAAGAEGGGSVVKAPAQVPGDAAIASAAETSGAKKGGTRAELGARARFEVIEAAKNEETAT